MRQISVTIRYDGEQGEVYEVQTRTGALGNPAFDRQDAEIAAKRAIDRMFEKGPGQG